MWLEWREHDKNVIIWVHACLCGGKLSKNWAYVRTYIWINKQRWTGWGQRLIMMMHDYFVWMYVYIIYSFTLKTLIKRHLVLVSCEALAYFILIVWFWNWRMIQCELLHLFLHMISHKRNIIVNDLCAWKGKNRISHSFYKIKERLPLMSLPLFFPVNI